MKQYIAYNIVNGVTFYRHKNNVWRTEDGDLRIYSEDEVGLYFNKRKKKYELKTKGSLLSVKELI